MSFENKTVIVTGGAQGIGKSIAQQFLKEGAQVIVFDVKKPEYEVLFQKVDITNERKVRKALRKIGKLDVLINNAGIYFQKKLDSLTGKEWDSFFSVNVKGTFLMSKYALPLLRKSKGCIVNVSSALSVKPDASCAAYCSSKAALNMLTKTLALEVAKDSVRINAVLPGPIDTGIFSSEKEKQDYIAANPMKRIGKPEEVAHLVLFLCSEKATYITGMLCTVDGGEALN